MSNRALKLRLLACAAALVLAPLAVHAEPASKPSFAEPSLSPDGSTVVFSSGGAIWTAPVGGGQGRILISDQASDGRPLFSPDGSQVAFTSTKTGQSNIYVLTLATGAVRRLTFADTNESLDAWSRDGKWIYFTSGVNDVGRQGDIFRVGADGGTPLEVSRERYLNEFQSAPSPDGSQVAMMAKGIGSQQWWRDGHAHIDEAELWVKPTTGEGGYRQLLGPDSKHLWPMWSADGGAIYYMSDASGSENIWRLPTSAGAKPDQVTHFTEGRVLWPSIGYDGKSIVFERGFAIWRLDVASGQAAEVPITLVGAAPSPGDRHLNETSFNELALSPDGKKVALTAHGEVFAASAKDGGAAQRVTHTPQAEHDLAWSPDSRRVAYISDEGPNARLVQYDFAGDKERVISAGGGLNTAPAYAPDGKHLAYVREDRELHVATLGKDGAVEADKVVFTGALSGFNNAQASWSPDSKWLGFFVTDHRSFRNVWVAPAEGGAAQQVSFLANGSTNEKVAWAPDGKYILFDTAQRSEEPVIVRVDLVPHTPKYKEDTFRDLFKPEDEKPGAPGHDKKPGDKPRSGGDEDKNESKVDAKDGGDAAKDDKKAKKIAPVKIVFEGIRARASILPLGMPAEAPVISPDGKTLVFKSSGGGGQESLYSYSLDELAKEPPSPQQIASSKKSKDSAVFSPDSKSIFYLDDGTVTEASIESPKPKAVAISGELDTRFDVEKDVVFDEAWSTLDRRFFDETFNGNDWVKLRDQWKPYIEGARTPDELRRDINLLIGELNASHSGINAAASAPAVPVHVGNLGLRFDREAYEAGRGLIVREVVRLGPADIEGSIKPGDVLVSVNGAHLGPHDNLDDLLRSQIGKRVVLGISTGGKTRDAVVRPIANAAATGLLYRQWVDERRAYVEKISGGKLGYVHIPDMGDESLVQLYLDLDAQNQGREGVVVDVRNNNGGYINGRVVDVFARRNYLTMTPRGMFGIPSRQALGQRALGLPTVLVTNESSLSDAEDFTEGYRSQGLGEVVGTPTAGWIIFTSGQSLIDGSVVRMPFIRIQTLQGENMEMHPRPVDVEVSRPLGETEDGHDAQLEAAVRELLKKVQ